MLENLSPTRVFHFFEEIAAIPHGSGHTDAISEYCVRFAAAHGLACEKDALNNVLIRKPASAGYGEHPTVILQGHLDMVCEKTADSTHDFATDGLKLCVQGDLLTAEDTTLGADDGIAVAMILAILEDDTLPHPPLEALFTVDEEVGMDGAQAVDVTRLHGSTLINLDSGEEGVLTVGCAGGAKVDLHLPIRTEPNTLPCWRIALSGLAGGHSGIDIHKGRQNADVLIGRLLELLPFTFRLVSVEGGYKDNVIPNACTCVIACADDPTAFTASYVQNTRIPTDAGLTASVAPTASAVCLDAASTAQAVHLLTSLPSGVITMSREIRGQVQSSMNIGVVATEKDALHIVLSVRSSVAAEKQVMLEHLQAIAGDVGAAFSTHGDYPAWEYRQDSRLRETMVRVYTALYGKPPVVETVHAGLECGLFSEKIPGFDAVSMGPDMWDIHTVNERLSVASTARTYTYVCEILKEL